ncbi:hypothetical protein [Acinetobacter baumannii]|uniref:hypothetical protein n=1 Tax=Acinetobacter baumannii TaxID=470 RepID=UPI0003AA2857|nr:hypothetical protein [Acinetobacter baumannii]KHY83546.2 hypothetical protein RQ26_01125 [Acinetobacter baumannii]KNZ35404.1 hypothetical protein RQ13_20155 [Acinetobacter baumannii]KQE51837.1 hypothetical protein APD47_08290 [Acinetobacter baumannii]KQF52150.1 hypothetical protein APC14_07100 [Acinetobacter baumannii]KQG86582.1 hypothetical protein APC55_06650 [Acinetobacter baumannii]
MQAISNWQAGSNEKKGNKLKELCVNLPEKFRLLPPNLVLFRQISLDNVGLSRFLREKKLPEKISSWTTDYKFAEKFKGGVPSELGDFKATIFKTTPLNNQVIVSLSELYKCSDFCNAMKLNKNKIDRYHDGAGKYWDTQSEVIMATEYLDHSNIYSMGGYSGTPEQIAEQASREKNIPISLTIDDIKELSRDYIGPWWLSPEGTRRAVARTLEIARNRGML